jgi:hypothetical protein
MFNPEIHLDSQELADLAGIVAHPGIKVLHKIARSCIDQFMVDCINQETDTAILSSHKSAKVAAQLFTSVVNRVNVEIHDYVHRVKDTDVPEDVTKNLDLGDTSDELEEELI